MVTGRRAPTPPHGIPINSKPHERQASAPRHQNPFASRSPPPRSLPSMMTTPTWTFTPGEAVEPRDGLIHGVSTAELQLLGEQCFEAKTKAYCKWDAMHTCARDKMSCGVSVYVSFFAMLTATAHRPVLALSRRRISPPRPTSRTPRAPTLRYHYGCKCGKRCLSGWHMRRARCDGHSSHGRTWHWVVQSRRCDY